MGMAVAVTSAATTGQWPGPAAGQLALAGGQYYCPVAAESLVQAPGAAQTADQLVYAAPSAGPQHGSYQTVELSDGGHHLVAAGQSSEVRQLRFNLRVYEVLGRRSHPPPRVQRLACSFHQTVCGVHGLLPDTFYRGHGQTLYVRAAN